MGNGRVHILQLVSGTNLEFQTSANAIDIVLGSPAGYSFKLNIDPVIGVSTLILIKGQLLIFIQQKQIQVSIRIVVGSGCVSYRP